jgi:hypothetical protein
VKESQRFNCRMVVTQGSFRCENPRAKWTDDSCSADIDFGARQAGALGEFCLI